jgi:phosphatidylglycerol---prolipoprotein diacylglyceryl transferase
MTLLEIPWNIDPTIFKIGSFEVRWYGLLFASGFLIGYQIMTRIFKVENKPEKDLDSLLFTMIIATVLGARFGHYFFYEYPMLLKTPGAFFIDMIMPPYRGLASHGALFGIPLALYIYGKRHKDQPFLWVADRIVITVALAGFFIRMGNLMNSEIVGKATNVPWAFTFLQNTEYSPAVPRHPAQLYEALSCLILFVILYYMWNRTREKTPRGLLIGIFLIWVFGLRFFYEFLKENQVDWEQNLPINMGQILSIPGVLFGLYLLINSFRKTVVVEAK